jgi:DNA helicase-2/ATP-dependent DNA helicase PcrA
VKAVAEKTGYADLLNEERKLHLDELIASGEGRDIREFIDKVSLMSSMDSPDADNAVSLMTLHNAKGLEFPVVFVTGLEEGLLPYFKALGGKEEISEERRLFYVGMTRARELLYLTGARKRRLYAKLQEQEPSRFLKDIPRGCCRWIEKITETQAPKIIPENRKRPEKKILRPLFASGCRVKHPVWGVGVVRDCYGDGEDQKVMVNFPNIGLKRLSLKMANLTKI